MKKILKSIFYFALILSFALFGAGCGSKKEDSSKNISLNLKAPKFVSTGSHQFLPASNQFPF